jgi:hypothetical protein
MAWDDTDGYTTILPRLAQVGKREACFITGMHVVFRGPMITPLPVLDKNLERAAAGVHKVAAYVAAVLLYMANGGTNIDNTARQYMKQAVAVEESVAAAAGGGGTMLRECFKCRWRAVNVIWRGRWRRPLKRVAPASTLADVPCAGENCGAFVCLEWGTCRLFCSGDCQIRGKIKLFLETILE